MVAFAALLEPKKVLLVGLGEYQAESGKDLGQACYIVLAIGRNGVA